MIENLEEILNPEQYAAATAGDGPLLVLAAAGTGKTQTLVYRVAYLVDKGVDPESILLLTFTNKAANEMLERAKGTVGPAVGDIWSGTFHHVCNRILRIHAPYLGYRSNFLIADRDDSRRMIDKAMKQVGVSGDKFPKREVLSSLFGNAANRGISLREVLEEKMPDMPFNFETIEKIYDVYTSMKFDDGIMDFDDLLVNAVKLFEIKPEILNFYKNQFKYILVDEYQDTNAIQSRFVDMLAGANGNIMAVGDDFQCIYTWRGADFRNIMDFPRRYPNAQVIKLERNYRSTPEVLDIANACIACNREQFQKTLRATKPHGDLPQVYHIPDSTSQSQAITMMIRRFVQQEGYNYSDIAVLYRSHFHSIDLQMMLGRSRIPHFITSGLGVFDTLHAKDVLSLLRLVVNPQDSIAFERFFTMFPGVGPQTASKMWIKLGRKCDFSTSEGRMAVTALLKPAGKAAWEPVEEVVGDYFSQKNATGKELIIQLIDGFLDAFYTAKLRKDFEDYLERIDDLMEIGKQIEERGNLEEFLQEVALMTSVESEVGSDNSNKVRLSTVHQAKGLEWPIVFILWLSEDMFPAARAIRESEDDTEERRLFYVAVTRARRTLILFSPQVRRGYDNINYPCKPSRFLKEIPDSLYIKKYNFYF